MRISGTSRQILAASSASLSAFAVGMSFAWSSPVLEMLLGQDSPIPMTPLEASWMVAIIEGGNYLSPIPAGYLVNKIGRKWSLLSTGPITAAGYILAMYSRSVQGLYVMRLLQGFSMSATFLISPIYLGEIAEDHIRGTVGTLMQISIHLGILYTYCLGTELSYYHYQLFSLVVPILFMATFVFMPESPYYYVINKEEAKAIESLKWLRNKKEEELQDEMLQIKLVTNKKDDGETSLSEFFERSNMKALGFMLLLCVFRQFSNVQSIIAYANKVFGESVSFLPPKYVSILFAIILLVSIFPSTYLVDRSGRKMLMLTSSAGCAVFSMVAAVYYYVLTELHYEVPYTSWIPFASVSFIGLFFNIGFGPIFTPLMSEYFSTSMKAASSALINLWGTTLGLVSYKLFFILHVYIGLYSNFLFASICCILCTGFLWCFMFETKGKTFAQIQYMFQHGEDGGKSPENFKKNDFIKTDA